MLDLGYSWIFGGPTRSKQKLGNQSGRKKKIEKKYGSSFEAVAACGGKPIKFELKSMIVVLYTAWGQPVEGRASPQEPERSPHGMLQYARLFPGFFE